MFEILLVIGFPAFLVWYMFQPLPEERHLPKEEWAGRKIMKAGKNICLGKSPLDD